MNRKNKTDPATISASNPKERSGGKSLEELSLDDSPLRRARDLVREFKASGELALGDKTLTTISQYPWCLKWVVEDFARRASRSQEAAVGFLLCSGVRRLWNDDVLALQRARAHILAHGTTDDRFWLDRCPPIEIRSAGTGFARYVVRIADDLRSEAGVLATTPGIPLNHILIIGVMAGLLNADVVPPRYREAIRRTVREFYDVVARRAVQAQALVDKTPTTDHSQVGAAWDLERDLWTSEEDDDDDD